MLEGMKLIGAGAATIALAGAAIGIGNVFSSLIKKNPSLAKQLFGYAILGFALTLAALIGYVLPWGQMSFWGATIIRRLANCLFDITVAHAMSEGSVGSNVPPAEPQAAPEPPAAGEDIVGLIKILLHDQVAGQAKKFIKAKGIAVPTFWKRQSFYEACALVTENLVRNELDLSGASSVEELHEWVERLNGPEKIKGLDSLIKDQFKTMDEDPGSDL